MKSQFCPILKLSIGWATNESLYQNSVNLWRARLLLYIAYFTVLHALDLGRDWLSMQSSVAVATFMNEFAPYAMLRLLRDALVKLGLQNLIIVLYLICGKIQPLRRSSILDKYLNIEVTGIKQNPSIMLSNFKIKCTEMLLSEFKNLKWC